jgi:putative transposase
MYRTCKIKLGKAPEKEKRISEVLEICRELYNAALQQRREAWTKSKKSVSFFDQCKDLTQLRLDDPVFGGLPVTMLRLTSLDRANKAYQRAFSKFRRGEHAGFPRYKKPGRFNTLFFGKKNWKIVGKSLHLNLGGTVLKFHMKNSFHVVGKIVQLSITEKQGRLWANFLFDIGPSPEVKTPKKSVGIDVGIKNFASLSDGLVIDHPHFLKQCEGKIKELHSNYKRKVVGSNRYKKAKLLHDRAFVSLANRRKNFIQQTVSFLIKEYDGFAVEELKIENMAKKDLKSVTSRSLRKNIMDSSWSSFSVHLRNKAEEAGYPCVRVDPKNTSKMCSSCGEIVEKTIYDRVHICPFCGLSMDRDQNAARNILLKANNLGWRLASDMNSCFLSGAEMQTHCTHNPFFETTQSKLLEV